MLEPSPTEDRQDVIERSQVDTSSLSAWRLPPSFYVWAVLLILTFLPSFFPGGHHSIKDTAGGGLSTADFQKLVQAESTTRVAVTPVFSKAIGKKRRLSTLDDAAQSYYELATEAHGVLSARRYLVLDHLRKKPLDEKFLTGTLVDNLRRSKATPGTIVTEVALWRTLYGEEQLLDVRDVDNLIVRIRAWKLGLLEGQAISDLYLRAGRKADADIARKHMESRAASESARSLVLTLVLGVAFLVGLILLVYFGAAWKNNEWHLVGRIPTPERSERGDIPGGELLDIFVAYLVFIRGSGMLVSLIPGITQVDPVVLTGVIYVGSGMVAVGYLLNKARRGNWSLAELGIQVPEGAGKNIFYGLAGYCASLPLVACLGLINNKLLHSQNNSLTPNPILPLIAGEGNAIGRLFLFLLVAVAAPLLEELFFRGVLFTALRTRHSAPIAIMISGACFAVVHPMSDWLPIFGLGCALATVREMRRSLVPGMTMHFCQNASAFLSMSVLFGR